MFAKRRKGRVYVYYYKEGLRKSLPRRQTYHLDNATDEEIEAFLVRQTALQKARQSRPDTAQIPDGLAPLRDEFIAYYRDTLKRQPPTLIQYESYINRAGLMFGWPLEQWPLKAPRFAQLCRDFKYSRPAMFKMRQCILVFWYWLRDMGYVAEDIRIPKTPASNKTTPLENIVYPETVLALSLDDDLRLIALLCYFCSLRPQETICIKELSFAAGKATENLECCKVMAKINLFSKLAVHIAKQRHNKVERLPKANSIGWVACFNESAAREIIQLVQKVKFEYRMDSYQRRWKDLDLGFTLKDLRRSSLYWLGHHTDINVVQLKNHARHSSLETTALYVRRPDAQVKRGLNLDD